jgi:hypothetical protein
MSLPLDMNFKAFVVFIAANFARSHIELLAFDHVIRILVRNTGRELHNIDAEDVYPL